MNISRGVLNIISMVIICLSIITTPHIGLSQCDFTIGDAIEFSSFGGNVENDYANSYILTSMDGNILSIADGSSFIYNVEGTYNIYAINYKSDENLVLTTNTNINNIQHSCYSLSQPYSFTICPILTECYGCEGEAVEFSSVGGTQSSSYFSNFFITDLNDEIIAISDEASFSNLIAGPYKAYSINYDTDIGIDNFEVGNNKNDIMGSCYDISNAFMFSICRAKELSQLMDRTICAGEAVRLSAPSSGYTSYQWSTGSFSSFIEVSPVVTTDYSLTVTDLNGCTTSKSITVQLDVAEQFDLGENILTCNGEGATLEGPIGSSSYSWSNGASTASIFVSPVESTIYSLTTTDNNGCTASDFVAVIVDNNTSGNTEVVNVCQNEQVEIFAGVEAESYLWSNGQTSSSIIVSQSTDAQYGVVASTRNGCSISKSFNVVVSDIPVIGLASMYEICQGEEIVLTANEGYVSYAWSNGATTSTVSIAPIATSNIGVTVTNDQGCVASQMINVLVNEVSTLDIGSDRVVCQNTDLALVSNVIAQSYQWSTGASTNNITVEPTSLSEYSLTVTYSNGCTAEDNVVIDVTDECTLCILYDCDISCSYDIGLVEFSSLNGNQSSNYTSQYLLVDDTGVIQDIQDATQFNIVASGVYFIFSINYPIDQVPANLNVGAMLESVTGDCFKLSEPYVIKVCDPVFITSVVWKDHNGNGVNDVNEPVIPGVIVSLYTCDGVFVQSVLTDDNGVFAFTQVPEGQYYLSFDLSNLDGDCVFTVQDAGYDDLDSDVDNTGLTACFPVITGITTTNVTAGVTLTASIGNFVWEDINGDGVQGVSEPGVGGIQVSLIDINGDVVSTQVTNDAGFYFFSGLNPGSYYLEYSDLGGYEVTFPNMGINNSKDSEVDQSNGPNTTPYTYLDPGETDLDWDAGLYKCVEIGDLVWYDINENDIWDSSENGINGLVVNLWRQNMDGSYAVFDTDYTGHKPGTPSDDGYYKFCSPPGEYYIEIILPPYGLVPAKPNVGFNEENDSDIVNAFGAGTTESFVLLSNEKKCDLGAGYYPMAEIGDRVWNDSNQNGIQDNGEQGVENIQVRAFNLFGEEVGSNITDADGRYNINYLMKDDYYLQFDIPAGFNITQADVGADDQVDSDVDHSFGTGTTPMYSLKPGLQVDRVDVGLVFGVLPLDWVMFDVYADKDFNLLNWSTVNEINVDYFDIERKVGDLSTFESIGKIASKGSENSDEIEYNFKDYDQFVSGRYYYRIKSVDMDGRIDYTDIKGVNVEDDLGHGITVLPNPSDGLFRIECNQSSEKFEEYIIYSSDGKEVLRSNKVNASRSNKTIFDLNLTSQNTGVYWCKIIFKDKIYHESLIKQ